MPKLRIQINTHKANRGLQYVTGKKYTGDFNA